MEATKGVLQKLSDALTQLQQLTDLATKKIVEAKKIQTESLQRLEEVEGREKQAALKDGRIRSAEKLDEEQNALLTAQSTLVNDQKAFDKKCSEREALVNQREADLASGLKDLRARRQELEDEKETYKRTILAKLGR